MPGWDIGWLNAMGDFCVKYGGWAAFIIMLVLYVGQLKSFSKWRRQNAETFEHYHNEIVGLTKSYAGGQSRETTAINTMHREIRACRDPIQRLLDFMVQHPGLIKMAAMSREDTMIIENHFNNGGEKNGLENSRERG